MAMTPEEMRIRFSSENDTESDFRKLQKDLKDTATTAKRTQKDVSTSTDSISTMGRKAGMAGIQIQQFTGQVQAGTNPLLALSQQSADLGFVLGVPLVGAIAGLASSLAMTLLPSVFDSTTAFEKYEKAMDSAKDATERLDDGQFALAETILETAKISQIAAKLDIAKAVSDYEKAIRLTIQAADELTERSGYMGSSLSGEMEDADDATQRLIISLDRIADIQAGRLKTTPKGVQQAYDALRASVSELGLDYDKTRKLADLYNTATAVDANPDDMLKFSDALGEVALSLDDEALESYAGKLSDMAVEGIKTKAALDLLKESIVDLPNELKRSGDLLSKGNYSLDVQSNMDKEYQRILDDRKKAEDKYNRDREKSENELVGIFNQRLADEDKAFHDSRAYQLAVQDSMDQAYLLAKEHRDEAYEKSLKESLKQMKPIEDGLTSLITGSKSAADSFKDMARSIVNDLIRIQIQQSITKPLAGLMASSGGASGILSSFSSFIGFGGGPAKALGGPVKAGQAYTVGEHGRETFIPDTNGQIVPNGYGEGVTIVQNINVSTGVQQTVRTEIASLMPQIAAASKQAVLDARKRGGSFGAAFGA